MRAFRYSLESVLDIRRIQEDRRKGELAAAAARSREHRDALAATQQDIEQAMDDAPALRAARLNAWAMILQDGFLSGRRKQRRLQEVQLKEAQQAEANARRRLLQAHRETRTCEMHRDRTRRHWLAEQRREETRQQDDVGALLQFHKKGVGP
jgi:flagellar FliJ protein